MVRKFKVLFYEQELQKTTQEIFRIEKVIRKRGKKFLVKWFGYPESFNYWIDASDITQL
jgi:Chromo (CHRromatin Organisation MOdifier) domain